MTSTICRFLGSLAAVALGVSVCLCTSGCEESESRTSGKAVRAQVEEAGGLMEERIEGGMPEQELETLDEQIAQLQQQGASGAIDAQTFAYEALKLAKQRREIVGQYDQSQQQRRQRKLQEAETTLQQATAAARGAGKVAPQLMLGTVNMAQGQQAHMELRELDQEHLRDLTRLVVLRDQLARESIRAMSVRSEYEQEAAGELRALLSESGLDLRSQLEEGREHVVVLGKKLSLVESRREEHAKAAADLRGKRLAKLAEAEQAQTAGQRLAAGTAAYELEVGCIDCPIPSKGLLHHEAQAQLAQEEIDSLGAQIAGAKLNEQRLQEAIAAIESDIEALEQSQTPAVVEEAIGRAQDRQEELLAQARELLAGIEKQHERYQEALLSAVSNLKDAQAAFEKAMQTSRQEGEIRALVESALLEQIQIWRQDAMHQEAAAVMLEALADVEESRATIESLIQQRRSRAEQAIKSANELQGELEGMQARGQADPGAYGMGGEGFADEPVAAEEVDDMAGIEEPQESEDDYHVETIAEPAAWSDPNGY